MLGNNSGNIKTSDKLKRLIVASLTYTTAVSVQTSYFKLVSHMNKSNSNVFNIALITIIPIITTIIVLLMWT